MAFSFPLTTDPSTIRAFAETRSRGGPPILITNTTPLIHSCILIATLPEGTSIKLSSEIPRYTRLLLLSRLPAGVSLHIGPETTKEHAELLSSALQCLSLSVAPDLSIDVLKTCFSSALSGSTCYVTDATNIDTLCAALPAFPQGRLAIKADLSPDKLMSVLLAAPSETTIQMPGPMLLADGSNLLNKVTTQKTLDISGCAPENISSLMDTLPENWVPVGIDARIGTKVRPGHYIAITRGMLRHLREIHAIAQALPPGAGLVLSSTMPNYWDMAAGLISWLPAGRTLSLKAKEAPGDPEAMACIQAAKQRGVMLTIDYLQTESHDAEVGSGSGAGGGTGGGLDETSAAPLTIIKSRTDTGEFCFTLYATTPLADLKAALASMTTIEIVSCTSGLTLGLIAACIQPHQTLIAPFHLESILWALLYLPKYSRVHIGQAIPPKNITALPRGRFTISFPNTLPEKTFATLAYRLPLYGRLWMPADYELSDPLIQTLQHVATCRSGTAGIVLDKAMAFDDIQFILTKLEHIRIYFDPEMDPTKLKAIAAIPTRCALYFPVSSVEQLPSYVAAVASGSTFALDLPVDLELDQIETILRAIATQVRSDLTFVLPHIQPTKTNRPLLQDILRRSQGLYLPYPTNASLVGLVISALPDGATVRLSPLTSRTVMHALLDVMQAGQKLLVPWAGPSDIEEPHAAHHFRSADPFDPYEIILSALTSPEAQALVQHATSRGVQVTITNKEIVKNFRLDPLSLEPEEYQNRLALALSLPRAHLNLLLGRNPLFPSYHYLDHIMDFAHLIYFIIHYQTLELCVRHATQSPDQVSVDDVRLAARTFYSNQTLLPGERLFFVPLHWTLTRRTIEYFFNGLPQTVPLVLYVTDKQITRHPIVCALLNALGPNMRITFSRPFYAGDIPLIERSIYHSKGIFTVTGNTPLNVAAAVAKMAKRFVIEPDVPAETRLSSLRTLSPDSTLLLHRRNNPEHLGAYLSCFSGRRIVIKDGVTAEQAAQFLSACPIGATIELPSTLLTSAFIDTIPPTVSGKKLTLALSPSIPSTLGFSLPTAWRTVDPSAPWLMQPDEIIASLRKDVGDDGVFTLATALSWKDLPDCIALRQRGETLSIGPRIFSNHAEPVTLWETRLCVQYAHRKGVHLTLNLPNLEVLGLTRLSDLTTSDEVKHFADSLYLLLSLKPWQLQLLSLCGPEQLKRIVDSGRIDTTRLIQLLKDTSQVRLGSAEGIHALPDIAAIESREMAERGGAMTLACESSPSHKPHSGAGANPTGEGLMPYITVQVGGQPQTLLLSDDPKTLKTLIGEPSEIHILACSSALLLRMVVSLMRAEQKLILPATFPEILAPLLEDLPPEVHIDVPTDMPTETLSALIHNIPLSANVHTNGEAWQHLVKHIEPNMPLWIPKDVNLPTVQPALPTLTPGCHIVFESGISDEQVAQLMPHLPHGVFVGFDPDMAPGDVHTIVQACPNKWFMCTLNPSTLTKLNDFITKLPSGASIGVFLGTDYTRPEIIEGSVLNALYETIASAVPCAAQHDVHFVIPSFMPHGTAMETLLNQIVIAAPKGAHLIVTEALPTDSLRYLFTYLQQPCTMAFYPDFSDALLYDMMSQLADDVANGTTLLTHSPVTNQSLITMAENRGITLGLVHTPHHSVVGPFHRHAPESEQEDVAEHIP